MFQQGPNNFQQVHYGSYFLLKGWTRHAQWTYTYHSSKMTHSLTCTSYLIKGSMQKHIFIYNLQDRSDMISAPVVVHGMRLKASLDEIPQIGYALCCL